MQHQELVENLKSLRLFEMARNYHEAATFAQMKSLTFEQYLASLVEREQEVRQQRRVQSLIKAANILNAKRLETYDYSCRSGVTASAMAKLATGQFIEEKANIVFYGSFGLGKSHLATGLVLDLCARGFKCRFYDTHALINELLEAQKSLQLAKIQKRLDKFDVIICDELGYVPYEREGANLFFQMISYRYERKSLIFTTNLTYSEWEKVFIDSITTAAAIDRIIHRCYTFNIQGPSWRAEEASRIAKEKAAEI